MKTPVTEFDYHLPEDLIAQHPAEPRDASRLLILDRKTGELTHEVFRNIASELRAGDVVVFNTTKVFRARLVSEEMGVEMFLLKIGEGSAEVLLRPGKKFPEGSVVNIANHEFIVKQKENDGVVQVQTGMSAQEMFAFCDAHGQIPTPPYVETKNITNAQYQTVYAKEIGSVAAPTAGFHFTSELLERIRAKGVQIEEVVLHVGIGTFRPVQAEFIEDHVMHQEWVELKAETVQRIMEAKREGRRIIAVGTTTTRVLEGIAAETARVGGRPLLAAYSGELNVFITPGFQFNIIDGLITNFHLPKSTLLMLVSAFAGREHVLAAYRTAIEEKYRFFSFGDVMFICGEARAEAALAH
jgi:S-adenosylmethionine:tRNA ribosyltransferase-isomerase